MIGAQPHERMPARTNQRNGRRARYGVSTRKVDDLVAALGLESGISKSEVSRICGELDTTLEAFRTRSLEHIEFPTCSSMPPSSKAALAAESCAERWSSRPA